MISVVMIVRDGALTIERALRSVTSFDDVVVYDNGSTDGSQVIAKSFSNVRLVEDGFDGFGATKNRAARYAKHDWILILDADEALEPRLIETLHSACLDEGTVYLLDFKAFYRNQQIHYCGWSGQKIRRLYNRKATGFSNAHVHENILVEGMVVKEMGGGSVMHFSYQTLSDFIVKVDRYSSLYAESNCGVKESSPGRAVLSGAYSFFRTYLLKRGFLDGYVGLVISFSHMATNFYKYMKLYEANRDLRLGRK